MCRSASRDKAVRSRYLSAVTARVGREIPALIKELGNLRDSGARWCAAFMLGQDGGKEAKRALAGALKTEPARENVRAIAWAMNGAMPCT